VNGDGRPEVLLASGTGYLYCLDAKGASLWERRLGLAVHDVTANGGVIAAGTEDGEVHALDGAGQRLWSKRFGAAVTRLVAVTVDGRPVLVAGLGDGQLGAVPLR
jgi:outer membrane protein assembly factor BamB